MLFKTTSHHYPNTYMDQFCKALHPDFELGTICVAWFREATKHCTDLLTHTQLPSAYFWTTFKKFIFPDRSTEIISQNVPISIHPKRLSLRDCQALFLDIVNDYVQRAPRYSAESSTNAMLWRVFYSFLGIMTLGFLLIGMIHVYNKYIQPKKMINFLEEIFKPEKRLQATAKRSLRLSKTELRNIHIDHFAKTEYISLADGFKILTLKVGTKYEFLESLVKVSLQAVGKFHKLHEPTKNSKIENKVESLHKALQFLGDCKKSHLILVFEEDMDFEEDITTVICKSNSPRINKSSKKIPPLNCKGMPYSRLDAGSARNKATGADFSFSSPLCISPAQTSTPRSSPSPRSVIASNIPRNAQKRPPINKRSV